ncbi:amino acid permease-like protein [Kutzneria buriramensis]|uniref:Amino acid permease-like protein n=1 Tax=Kutzneria buriramensis TaxID=1045776 RepID=A0A3E0G405_9PSEU|nr:amino acid permease-like protein [Kutzneria buriramensis]
MVLFSAVILVVNALTVNFFGTLEYWFSMVKVTAIAVFVVLGFVLIFFGLPGQHATGFGNLTSHGGLMPGGFGGLGIAMIFALFSYFGTEVVSVTAAESKDSVRDIPRAARKMVLRIGFFYVLAVIVIVSIVPWTVAAQDSSPFVNVFAPLWSLAACGATASATVRRPSTSPAPPSATTTCSSAATTRSPWASTIPPRPPPTCPPTYAAAQPPTPSACWTPSTPPALSCHPGLSSAGGVKTGCRSMISTVHFEWWIMRWCMLQSSTRLSRLVHPPSAQWVTWWAWHCLGLR